ncbi:MAG: hypothetical protein LBG60_11440 [Bifidobacteriaceae bacterium]|nr:hypothetical protein [Bifidobacteriaceae bacterium]
MTTQYQLPVFDSEPVEHGLEERFDIPLVARLALREKQIQQNYRPIIQIHKWFARRPGSVFRSLLLAEFGDQPLVQTYFSGNQVEGVIADPFMGGGTTVFEATRIGLKVVGCDINPMAYWTVRQALNPLSIHQFRAAAREVVDDVRKDLADSYRTTCSGCGKAADVKYFIHVKTCRCPSCGSEVSLFPGLRLAEARRHPREVYHCPACDCLREVPPSDTPRCPGCGYDLRARPVQRGAATCHECGARFKHMDVLPSPPAHRMFGLEYHCRHCYRQVEGRQFKTPDAEDLHRLRDATAALADRRPALPIPDDEIPPGDETSRLRRWGYSRWAELFNDRQLLGLGLLMLRIGRVPDPDIRHALATVFSDFLRYQNLLCRYDTHALKCQDVFAVHGFPVALLACENNLLGIPGVGSGSFVHFVEKYAKAKDYAQLPYEIGSGRGRQTPIVTLGERIEAPTADSIAELPRHKAFVTSAPSQSLRLAPRSLDGVFTDPPYFSNVQYAELMDFCYVWLKRLVPDDPHFAAETTRSAHEATGNATGGRGIEEFTGALSAVYRAMSRALKPGAPLVFTYHHNDPMAYAPLVVAILDAGLTCTEVLPVPGEMSASLHIAGTKSSILDSVFVCRQVTGEASRAGAVSASVARDVRALKEVPYNPTEGDLACLTAGHVAAAAVRELREGWSAGASLSARLGRAAGAIARIQEEHE